MFLIGQTRQSLWRTLLVLGRVSNLPTVWSNCLAGWILGGGGPVERFLSLCVGASCLYIGGMYLNDAFDAEFDRQRRSERPIPSGAISERAVWLWSFGWLGIGSIVLIFMGHTTAVLTIMLLVCIVVYDAIHKAISYSPVLMSLCRFWLVLVAASTALKGVTGLAVWSAVALACYIVGLSYLARRESTRGMLRYWPLLFLAAPLLLAYVVNTGNFFRIAMVLSLILCLWVVWCLRFTFMQMERNIGLTVSGLLAGIVLVDLLAVAGGTPLQTGLFLVFFILALVFQRFIPAT